MKILAGNLRGRTIAFKANPKLRPTSDKVRQAVFNRLQGQVEGRRVLDLFSGTGALGIESLSLGAGSAIFVELDPSRSKKIRSNLELLGLKERTKVLSMDALAAIQRFSAEQEIFDLIFLDPPYEKGLAVKTLEALSEASIFSKDALIVAETRKSETLPVNVGPLQCLKDKLYGDTRIGVYGPRPSLV